MAQIVMPPEQTRKLRLLARVLFPADFLDAKGQQLNEPNSHFFSGLRGKEFRLARGLTNHATDRRPARRWQSNPSAPVELEQQRARCHVLELPGRTAPPPEPGQLLADPFPVPLRVPGYQASNLRDFCLAKKSPLVDAGFEHDPDRSGAGFGSPEKNKSIFPTPQNRLDPAATSGNLASGQQT
jgi:hypothetical protein